VLTSSRAPETWRVAIRGITHMLVVPQGFALSVTGVFAITVEHRGFPGPIVTWLFVAGAGFGFCCVTLASGAHRETSSRPVSIVGLAMTNLLPTVVVPAACGSSWWIRDKPACFLTAGACASVFYLAGLAAFIVILHLGLPRVSHLVWSRSRRKRRRRRRRTRSAGRESAPR
jgi:hypothetical protein